MSTYNGLFAKTQDVGTENNKDVRDKTTTSKNRICRIGVTYSFFGFFSCFFFVIKTPTNFSYTNYGWFFILQFFNLVHNIFW